MGKNKGGIPQKEHFQRIHYLYQAAHLCLKNDPKDLNLCRYYLSLLRVIAKKTVLRLHVEIKRTLCKKCCVLLVPGVTATVRTKSKKQKNLVVSCLECDTVKRFPLNKDYKLWIEKPEAWLNSVILSNKISSTKEKEEKT